MQHEAERGTTTEQETRVLLVEDLPDYAALIQAGLTASLKADFKVKWVGSLSMALQNAHEEAFDVVVLDLGLPDSRGPTTVSRFRAECPHLPIVVLSAEEENTTVFEALSKGAQEYLIKEPSVTPQLVRAIQYAIDRKKAEAMLDGERRLLSALLDNSPDSIYFKDAQGRFTIVNRSLAARLGFSDPRKATGLTAADFYSAGYARQTQADEADVMASGRPMVDREEKEVWPNGAESWVSSTKVPLLNDHGDTVGLFGISRDVTERKLGEDMLRESREQLRALAARQDSVRENERIRISREIHDELGYGLTATKMNVAWVRKQLAGWTDLPTRETVEGKLNSAVRLLDDTVASVHRIAAELRPGILDHLGLAAAIEWQAQQFQKDTGIVMDLAMSDEDLVVEPQCTTAVYRIFEELLTNMARHAGASEAHVRLDRDELGLLLEVQDNGRGITEKQKANPRSLGLLGIRERARLLGGSLDLVGVPNGGTTVTLRIPLDSGDSAADKE